MEKNLLKEIPSGLPASLEQLRLSKNSISRIPAGVFNKMTNLTLLDLYNNRVKPSLEVFILHAPLFCHPELRHLITCLSAV